MYDYEDKPGNRKLSKQRCLEMDWGNRKEITAWEIAWCLLEYPEIRDRANTLHEERKGPITKEIIAQRLERIKISKSLAFDREKQNIISEYPDLDLDSVKTRGQLQYVVGLITDDDLREVVKFVLNEHTPRDTKRYDEHYKSYIDHLHYAYDIHKEYYKSFRETDKEAIEIVDHLFEKLIDLGLPKPLTVTEVKREMFVKYALEELLKTNLSVTSAKKLAKQITKIHFSR